MLRTLVISTLLTAFLAASGYAGQRPRQLSRRPYVQNLGRTSVTIMWRSETNVAQTVQYGRGPRVYDQSFVEQERTTQHEVTLTDLEPGAPYVYRIVESGLVVADGPELRFRTDAGRQQTMFEFFVTGDIGVEDPSETHPHETQATIRTLSPPADLGLLAGDIVYPDGDSRRYDAQLMTPWQDLLSNTPVWPALGNHDWGTNPDENFAKEWALPNNEHYYSFDYGNAHFIALDTKRGSLYDEAAQLAWLEQDLARNTQATWTFVYFHYPLITCTYKGNEPQMAAQLTPLFEQYGVDLVFTGHAHTYERLYPILQGVPVHRDQDPFYEDPTAPIYVVSGCGGKVKLNNPTSYCGPTAFYLDEHILFTQVYVRDHLVWVVTYQSQTGIVADYMSIRKTPAPTDVRVLPSRLRLLANIPNPFNPATLIPFELPHSTHVQLDVFGMNGRWITRLTERLYPAGMHRVLWTGVDHAGQPVPSGVYVVRMQNDGRAQTRKVQLLR
jgi:3',5'-cyclic AMP phosphodiesterase CpdA